MRWGLALLALLAPSLGWASPTDTCVQVRTDVADAEQLKKLVTVELDRHSTHKAVESNCLSYLRVELIEVAGVRYVTGRINTQVPHRERVEGDDLAAAVEETLAVLLHNDPVRLRGPRQQSWLRRQFATLRSGRTGFGLEAYQLVALDGDGGIESLPGLALHVRREVADWQIEAQLAVGLRIDEPRGRALTGHGGLKVGVRWYFGQGDTAFYLGTLAGLELQRFEGPSAIDGAPKSFSAIGFALGPRVGVELLRTARARLDLFGQVMLPAFAATDEDEGVVDGWFPTASLGVGAVF
ncbi:MAG: hypothetical protein KC613_11955 [Myxococcales bacterium]|nr:hypothetical protein [Myxococcales bacterium]